MIPISVAVTAILMAAPGTVVATYRGGQVSDQDLASWRRFREIGVGKAADVPLRDDVEPIVLLRVLDARFDSLPAAPRREHAIRMRHWKMALAEERVRDVVRLEAAPTEAEIRQAFEADPAAYALPRHWQIENILKRFPERATAEGRARLRRAMEAIRERAVAGEDFARLAKEESESETRLLGGSAGAVSLDQLSPEVARVVSGLAKGDISPVIETRDGLSLLRCVGIIEAQPPSLDRARRIVSLRVGGERFDRAWESLVSRLDAELQAAFPAGDSRQGPAEEAVATFADAGGRSSVTREDFLLHVSALGLDLGAAGPDEVHRRLVDRVRREGFLREAQRRGLLALKDDDVLFAWKERELRARAVERWEVEAHLPEPTEAELRAAYAAQPAAYVDPPRVTLRAVKLPLRRDRPLSLYEKARRVGRRLAAGQMRFEEAARALGPDAEPVELGPLTADAVWMMGLNVDSAVNTTAPGRTTPLVQEGRTLWILHVVAKEPERRLSFEEARGQVRAALVDAARRRAVAEFRKRILEEQQVSLAP